jgi:MFS family permease
LTRYRHLITDDNRKWWTLGAMCFALFMIMLDNTVVNVALPSIQQDLGASISGLEWTINGYTLSFAVLLATGGRLGDIFGRRRMFLAGVVIFALSSATAGFAPDQTALVLALVEGNAWGWGSPQVIALLVGAAVALPAFVFVENRVKAPMVQFDLLSDRNFLASVMVALIITFAMMGVFFFLALYMQDILHYSPLEAGVRFLPSTLMIVGVAPVAGRLSDRFGPRWLIAGGLVLVAASLFSFSRIAVDSSYLDLLPGFVLLGIGIAMTMSPMTSAAMNAVPVQKAGIASGVLSMFRMVGGSLGIAVTGAIFQGLVSSKLDSLLGGTGVSAAQRESISDQLGGGGVPHVAGLNASQAQEVVGAGNEAFVYALSHAMTVSGFVALAGALIGATAIRAKARTEVTPEAAVAEANPGGEALAAEEREAVQPA